MVGRVHYFTVHLNMDMLFVDANCSSGIEGISALDGIPFVLIQSLEIIRIDNGVFALCKRYPAESVAVAETAIK